MSATDVRLRRLLRRPPVPDLLDHVDRGGALAVLGPDGEVLRPGPPDGPRCPVELDGATLGTVVGPGASEVAALLGRLAAVELERRGLADEVLALYREVNLLYALVERLAGASDRTELAERTLAEATRLVPADGAVVVVDDGTPGVAATAGRPAGELPLALDRARTERHGDGALLVAPLAVGEAYRGAIVLTRAARTFSAAELKLLVAVASQAAAFVERVIDAERRRAEAEAREERLRRQIAELRIELDDRRQAEQVLRITDTDYFVDLRAQAEKLRGLVDGGAREAGER